MSWTELGMLIDWLPMESATKAAMRDDALDRRWGEADYMRATQIVLLQALIRIAWVGGHLEGEPPKMAPPVVPQTGAEIDELAAKRRTREEKLDRIRALRPSTAPARDLNGVDVAAVAQLLAEKKPRPKRTS